MAAAAVLAAAVSATAGSAGSAASAAHGPPLQGPSGAHQLVWVKSLPFHLPPFLTQACLAWDFLPQLYPDGQVIASRERVVRSNVLDPRPPRRREDESDEAVAVATGTSSPELVTEAAEPVPLGMRLSLVIWTPAATRPMSMKHTTMNKHPSAATIFFKCLLAAFDFCNADPILESSIKEIVPSPSVSAARMVAMSSRSSSLIVEGSLISKSCPSEWDS